MLQELVPFAQVYFLVFARVFALFRTSPLLSSSAVPGIARGGLAFFAAVVLLPLAQGLDYVVPPTGLGYAFALIGEVLLGVIMGLFLQIVFAVFQTAGQMFSIQMGFAASAVFDPMAQVQIPLVGQLLNLFGLYIFIAVGGLQEIFLTGLYGSFRALKGVDLLIGREYLAAIFVGAVGELFAQSLIIAFPMISVLLMVSVTMGLLAKAAPQMNLLMVGFPLQIGIGLLVLMLAAPFIVETMADVVDGAWDRIALMLDWFFRGGAS